jgi:hypothetical protein
MPRPEPEESREGDWRFLLPATPTLADDLATAFNPGAGELDDIHASLRPGGVCYLAWGSRIRPSARSLTRRLERAGFSDVRLYWSWPRDIPSVWVPLNEVAAARWVIRRRRGRRLIYAAWRLLHAVGLLRPRCATALRPPVTARLGPLGFRLGELEGEPVWALLSPGEDQLNKVLAFVGVRGADNPALVLKLPRTRAAATALEREAASLQALGTGGESPPGVPRLLGVHRDAHELRAIAETPLEGSALFATLDRRHYPLLARRATEWLVELGRVRPDAPARAEHAAGIAADAAAIAAPDDRELLLEAGRVAVACESLPVVFEQRDFSPWNVHLARDGGLVVYDWESAEPAGFPALDLIYLLTYCGFFLDHAREKGRIRQSYVATFEGTVAGECLAHYCQALSIDSGRLPALRVLTWLVHARSTLRRSPTGSAAALFLDLLREELSGGGAVRGAR